MASQGTESSSKTADFGDLSPKNTLPTTPAYCKRVVLAVCTGWIGSVMMCSWRKQRCCYGLHVGDGV
jgi:hypothetical protein